MLVGETVAVDIPRQRFGGIQELGPGPARFRIGHARGVEQVAVVIDDQAGEVLRQAHQLPAEPKCLERLGEVVLLGDDLARCQQRSDRGQRATSGELPIAAVIDEEDIGSQPAA